MRHWLQAEQELAADESSTQDRSSANVPSRNSDVTPLQGTRAASAANASRDSNKRPSSRSPFSSDRSGADKTTEKNGSARRKPANAPTM